METVKTAGMEIQVYALPTPTGNYRTYCVVIYADGVEEAYPGKLFATKAEADEHAETLLEALRETQGQAQEVLS